jgi:hypothetical protein
MSAPSIRIPARNASPYHADRRNLPGTMTALLSPGDFTGGQLLLARWRLAFDLRPGDLLLFDGLQPHSNLPIVGDRASLVLYCARGLAEFLN